MVRTISGLLGIALLALVVALSGCQKELELPSYDIKIERDEGKRNVPPSAAEERLPTPQTTNNND